MAFKYRARSSEQLEKRAEQQGGDFQGFISDEFKTYAPKKGDNWIRILPPTWDDPAHYGMDVHVHYGIGPDRASAVCIAKQPHPTTGQLSRCPICEARARAEKAADEELAKELKPSRRVLVWLLDKREEDKGPQLWAMPWSVDRDIVKISRDKRSGEVYVIDHPDEGYDVMFDKEGEQLQTKYTGMQLARRASSVDSEHLEYIEGAPLPFTLRWRDYDELKTMFDGSGMAEPGPRAEARERPSDRDPAPERRSNGHDRDEREPPREERAPPQRRPINPPADERRDDYRGTQENRDRNADLGPEPSRDDPPFEGSRRRDPEPPREERAAPRDNGAASSSAKDRAAALREKFGAKAK